jgi:hypothetical protein
MQLNNSQLKPTYQNKQHSSSIGLTQSHPSTIKLPLNNGQKIAQYPTTTTTTTAHQLHQHQSLLPPPPTQQPQYIQYPTVYSPNNVNKLKIIINKIINNFFKKDHHISATQQQQQQQDFQYRFQSINLNGGNGDGQYYNHMQSQNPQVKS